MPVYKDENAKSNPWYFAVNHKDNGKYKKILRRGFKTKKEAETAMTTLQNDLNKGTFVERSATTYSAFMKDWLEDKKTMVKAVTLKTYKALVNNHIVPHIGNIELQKLTPRNIQSLYNTLQETEALSSENIQKVHAIINDSLNKALSWELVKKNVASVVDRPKSVKKEMEVWEIEEAHQFLKAAEKDRYYGVFLLALTTGMRQGEILGLRWKDVDLENRVLAITQTLSHDGKELQVGAKTDSGVRTVMIDDISIKMLEDVQSRCKREKFKAGPDLYSKFDLVFCTATGTPVSPRNTMRSFYRLVACSGVKKIRFHDLRHTHATMLLKGNVNPKIVAERLGWTDTKMLDRYQHVMPNMQKQAADTFGKLFFNSKAT